MSEKISRFLDGDLSTDEIRSLLEDVQEQPELKSTLIRYTALRHAMKHNDFLWVSPEFLTDIQQKTKYKPSQSVSPRQVSRYYWFALAAASMAAFVTCIDNNNQRFESIEPSRSLELEMAQKTQPSQTDCEKTSHSNNYQTVNSQNTDKPIVKLANYCKQ